MLKKIYIGLFIAIVFSLGNINSSYAETQETEIKKIKIIVAEPIPGTECTELKPQNPEKEKNGMNIPSLWECTTESGTLQAIKTIGTMIKFFTILASLIGVLFLVYNGILYSMGGIDQSLKEESKKRIIGTLIGLLLLFTSGYILQLIAPWVYS